MTADHDALQNQQQILKSPSYRLAAEDQEFLLRTELRPIRLQLELLKPEMLLEEAKVNSTIVVFGGTQVTPEEEGRRRLDQAEAKLEQSPEDPRLQRQVVRAQRMLEKCPYYEQARTFAKLVTTQMQLGKRGQGTDGALDFVIATGGGPGIMEAANRGAFETGGKSIGLNITLPHEQAPNAYITPKLCFQFHYFALRKMHFLMRAKALVVFPGGFGTLDELFDALTLRQTQRMQEIPIILYGREYWQQVMNFQFLADEGVIADAHLDLLDFADSPDEAWQVILRFHGMDV